MIRIRIQLNQFSDFWQVLLKTNNYRLKTFSLSGLRRGSWSILLLKRFDLKRNEVAWTPKVYSYRGLEFMKAFSTIDKANDLETFAIGSRNLWTSWPSSSVWRPIPGRLQSEEISAAAAKAQVSFGARARECQGRCGVPDWVGQACWWLLPPASSSWSLKT